MFVFQKNTESRLAEKCTHRDIELLSTLAGDRSQRSAALREWRQAEWRKTAIVKKISISPQGVDLYDAHLTRTFVPTTAQRLTEQETIRQSIKERQPHQLSPTVPWPPSSGTPINEFNTEGYISCAFPTLFPTGAADFVAPQPNGVTIGNYFKHLLLYDDGRFARHPQFCYFALIIEVHWHALQAGWTYVHQHPHDTRLSAEELHDMVGREG